MTPPRFFRWAWFLGTVLLLTGCAQLGTAPRQALDTKDAVEHERAELAGLQRKALKRAWVAQAQQAYRDEIAASGDGPTAEEVTARREKARAALSAAEAEYEAAARANAEPAPDGMADIERLIRAGKLLKRLEEAKAVVGSAKAEVEAAMDLRPARLTAEATLDAGKKLAQRLERIHNLLGQYEEADRDLAGKSAMLSEKLSDALRAYEERSAAMERLGNAVATGATAAAGVAEQQAEARAKAKAEAEAARKAADAEAAAAEGAHE